MGTLYWWVHICMGNRWYSAKEATLGGLVIFIHSGKSRVVFPCIGHHMVSEIIWDSESY